MQMTDKEPCYQVSKKCIIMGEGKGWNNRKLEYEVGTQGRLSEVMEGSRGQAVRKGCRSLPGWTVEILSEVLSNG